MQLVAENVPAPLAVNVTLPVGTAPVTVAVHKLPLPTTTGFGEHERVVLLAACVTLSEAVPDEAALLPSPP